MPNQPMRGGQPRLRPAATPAILFLLLSPILLAAPPAGFKLSWADVILLHAGHNHFVEEQPVAGILAATEKIITTARTINPTVIILVDQATGFDYNTDTVADKVHPNAQGAEKMARRWFEALVPLLK